MAVLGINITDAEPTTDWTGLHTSHPRPPCQHDWHTVKEGRNGWDMDGRYFEITEEYSVCWKCGAEDHGEPEPSMMSQDDLDLGI